MNLLKPKKLKRGDTIGIIAPSSGLASIFSHRTDYGKKSLEKMGFKVKFSSHSREIDGYVSASVEKRISDLHDMFKDKNIDGILATIGGDHANQLLSEIDFSVIKKNPKPFIGYSDITVLHFAFLTQANLQTFYGPCLISEFGEYPEVFEYTEKYFKYAVMDEESIGNVKPSENWTDDFLDWSEKKDLERPRKMKKSEGFSWWRKGRAVGSILGGTIPSINHLAGTKFWPDFNKKIFFIDIPEGGPGKKFPVSKLDSFLADLKNLELFNVISGLIIGRAYRYDEEDVQNLKKIINFYTQGNDYPILYNVNIGHASPILTVPLGSKVVLDSSKNQFKLLN